MHRDPQTQAPPEACEAAPRPGRPGALLGRVFWLLGALLALQWAAASDLRVGGPAGMAGSGAREVLATRADPNNQAARGAKAARPEATAPLRLLSDPPPALLAAAPVGVPAGRGPAGPAAAPARGLAPAAPADAFDARAPPARAA